jgi:HEAT repeat protein
MREFRHFKHRHARRRIARMPRARVAMLAVVLCLTSRAAAGEAPAWTPLLQLRWALKTPVLDTTPDSKDLQLRRNSVQEGIAGLSRLPDLREALLLQEWRDDDADGQVAAIDQGARLELTRRFEQALHSVLRQGDPASRIAAASMISDMPAPIRSNGIRGWTFRDCTADLADLVRGTEPLVQAAAAKALSAINADPAVAVPALAELMKSEDAVLRRAAAEGLAGLIGVAAQTIHRPNGSADPATRTQVFQVGRAILPVIGGALADPDPQVRRLCIEAIQRTADALVRIVGDPPTGYNTVEADAYRAEVAKQYTELWPLACDLKDQTAGLTNALSDPVAEVRLQAHHALEDMGRAWLRLESRAGCTPAAPQPADALTTSNSKDGNSEKPLLESPESKQPLLDRLHAALPAIATGVADPNVGARRAAIDALETLGTEASPAVPALVGALGDPDLFVRWSAIRALGRMGHDEMTKIVPGLVGSLSDSDLDVRVAAARTLGQFGSAAQEAVPALTKAASAGDTDMRLAAIQALEGIGSDAQSSLPTLAASLQAPDARVRQATARLMGKLGPAALEQKDVLKTALADRDADVRKAAGDALLRILNASASPPPFVVGEATVPSEVPRNDSVAEKTTPAVGGPDLFTVSWQDNLFAKSPEPALSTFTLEVPADPAPATGPVLTATNDSGPTLPAKETAKESSPVVPASVWQAASLPPGPALVSQTRLTQASLLRPTPNVMAAPEPSSAPAAISPAIAQQAAVVLPVANSPPAAVLMPPMVVYTPPPYRAPGPPPPGTVIARTSER